MKFVLPAILGILLAVSISGQTTTKRPVKKTPRPTPTVKLPPVEPTPEVVETAKTPAKKNERPTNQSPETRSKAENPPNYFYEFSQPKFIVSKITIEHDENGVGRISLMKQDWSEPDSDPIRVSEAALARIRGIYESLDFLNSTANYQYEKDYSHLGNHKFRLVRDGKARETTFNWTENKDAKALMDEYRRIGNQYIWIFDMNVARANQPLDAPKQMDVIDSYIERNEISDAVQLIPYLKEVSLDERIPLIARNHATRLIAQIEKDAPKK
ncbi:MAG: hypothetical protein IPN69_02930 [Acidobacteria bacterium]|nr:hypothetical protein [Acidobacteriota bacterium]